MEEKKVLPAIVRMRAERILKAPVLRCYRVEENNPNLAKCIMAKDNALPRYVDLITNKEVSALSVQVVDDVQKEDTNLLVGKEAPAVDFGYTSNEEKQGQLLSTNEDQPEYKATRQRKKKTELPVSRAFISNQTEARKKPVKKSK